MRTVVALAALLMLAGGFAGCLDNKAPAAASASVVAASNAGAAKTTPAATTPAVVTPPAPAPVVTAPVVPPQAELAGPPAPPLALVSSSVTLGVVPQTRSAASNHLPAVQAALASTGLTSVRLTLSATDADSDAVTWAVDFGDGVSTSGALLPVVLTHSYGTVGTYQIVSTVGDGIGQAASKLPFVARASDVASGASGPLVLSLDVSTYCADCEDGFGLIGAFPGNCIGWEAGKNGLDCGWGTIDATSIGQPFTATASNGGDVDLTFLASCDGAAPDATPIEVPLATGDEAGTVPDGAGCIMVWYFVGNNPPDDTAGGTVTVTIG